MSNRAVKNSLVVVSFLGVALSATACLVLYDMGWHEQKMWARVLLVAMLMTTTGSLWMFLRGGRG